MQLTLNKNVVQGNSAGLAIHDNFLRFIEIDEEEKLLRQEQVPLPEGCIVNGTIKDFGMLEAAFSEIHKLIGRLREPVVIGLPRGDTIIRLLTLPNMSIEDVRGTVDLNFDEYFPYPRADAVFDTLKIITPADEMERDESTILAVSAKRELIEKVLDIAKKSGLPAGAVEPLSFSMLRAIPDAQEGLVIFADPDSIVVIYNGSGIFFRSANNFNGSQDILNTIQFIGTTYRNVKMSKLIFAGLNFQIGTNTGIDVVNIEDEFFAARGLALRNLTDAQKLDMRPGKYVELERRRYSFNINRIILWGLLVAFVMLSIGTISFAWMRISYLEVELDDKRIANSDLLARRAALQRSNADLEKKQKHTEKVLEFLKEDIPVLEVMDALGIHATAGVKFDEAVFSRSNVGWINVVINGKASDEKSILLMTEGLKKSELFEDVRLPISQRAQTGQVIFKLILRVKGVV